MVGDDWDIRPGRTPEAQSGGGFAARFLHLWVDGNWDLTCMEMYGAGKSIRFRGSLDNTNV